MAITIIKQPQKYTPASNDSIFQFTTNAANFKYFLLEVMDSTSVVIARLKLRGTPLYINGAYTNLVDILRDLAHTTIIKDETIVQYTNDLFKYSVKVTEYVTNTSSVIVIGANITISNLYTFNAALPLDAFNAYSYTSYVANDEGTGRWLTDKPNKSIIHNRSTEYLYYVNDNRATQVRFQLHYKNGTTVNKIVGIDKTKLSGRINISPTTLLTNSVDLTNLKYYSIDLLDAESIVTVQAAYRYMVNGCAISNLNVYWTNELGGYDTYLFKNIRESISTTKIVSTVNPYKLVGGNYGTVTGNVFNATDVTLDSQSTSTITAVSEFLRNDEAKWITSIVRSKQVYVELESGMLYPIQITDNNVPVQNSRYNTSSPLEFEFSFKMPTGLEIRSWSNDSIQYFPYTLPFIV